MTYVDNEDTLENVPTMRRGVVSVHDWGASTSVGLVRKRNEDNYGREQDVFAVADGMGGLQGGLEASSQALAGALSRSRALGDGSPLEDWKLAIEELNEDLRVAMHQLGFARAGTTLTMVSVEPTRTVVVHVGDSRLYQLYGGKLSQLTEDHNLANDLKALGQDLIAAKEQGLPLRGLTSFVGRGGDDMRVDAFSITPRLGTRLLLCSDGIHGQLGDEVIRSVLASGSATHAAEELVSLADRSGGRDNSTALVVAL